MKYIDVTAPLAKGMPQWPGDPVFDSWLEASIARGAQADVTAMRLCAHTGTHVDAPSHYITGGKSVDRLPWEALVGPAQVIAVTGTKVTAADADRALVPRVLFRTNNSESEWWREPFRTDAAELDEAAARVLVSKGAVAVGIDYLSVGNVEVHRILLEAGVVVIEGLCLNRVVSGNYQLICLPLRLEGSDGAPARVLLLQ